MIVIVPPGHVLVSPRRVVKRFSDLTSDEVCTALKQIDSLELC